MSMPEKEREELIDIILARLNKSVKVVMESQQFNSVAEKTRDYLLGSAEFDSLVKRKVKTIIAGNIEEMVKDAVADIIRRKLSSLDITEIEDIIKAEVNKVMHDMQWQINSLREEFENKTDVFILNKINGALAVAIDCLNEKHNEHECDC